MRRNEIELVPKVVTCPEDALDDVYCDIKFTQTKNSYSTYVRRTVMYPFMFVYREHPNVDDVFVYHATLHFDNLPNDITDDVNSAYIFGNIVATLNDTDNKIKVIRHMENCLNVKKAAHSDTYTFEDEKMRKHCVIYLDKVSSGKALPQDYEMFKIVPLYLNVPIFNTSQETRLPHGNNVCFTKPTPSMPLNNDDEKSIHNSKDMYVVKGMDGVKIDATDIVSIEVKSPHELSNHASSKNETMHEKIVHHDIETADLYTFVLRYRWTNELIPINVFWDGDVEWADDTLENMDKMLYMTAGDKGIEFFIDVMEQNKYMPYDTLDYIKNEIEEFDVVGIYRVDVRNNYMIDYDMLDLSVPKSVLDTKVYHDKPEL